MNASASILRFLAALRRPSKAANVRGMRRRGEELASFRIRRAVAADARALAELHVATFNATHGLPISRRPTVALREQQWSAKLTDAEGSAFCFVVTKPDGAFVGFASGGRSEYPGFAGTLDKIYLLPAYQRLGFGQRLMGEISREFLATGTESLMLYSQPENPSCGFFEALGGERLLSDTGEFHGAYGWRSLRQLAARCVRQER